MTTGVVPMKMKFAKVVPIFKKGDALILHNYRPISLLNSFFFLILEKPTFTRTIRFLMNANILSIFQFVFREKHATTHAILHLVDKISSALDARMNTVGVFLDYYKVFDM